MSGDKAISYRQDEIALPRSAEKPGGPTLATTDNQGSAARAAVEEGKKKGFNEPAGRGVLISGRNKPATTQVPQPSLAVGTKLSSSPSDSPLGIYPERKTDEQARYKQMAFCEITLFAVCKKGGAQSKLQAG